jgi:hypothetical protein
MRTIIELPTDQIESLDEWCRHEGVSRAEAVRRAVAEHLRKHPAGGAKRAFGMWKDVAEDALAYQERLRSEWDDRERGWS